MPHSVVHFSCRAAALCCRSLALLVSNAHATRGTEVLNAARSAAAPSGQRDPTWSEASPMACLGSFTGSAVLLHLSLVLQLELTFLASTRIPSLLLAFVTSIRTSAFLIVSAVRHAVAKLEALLGLMAPRLTGPSSPTVPSPASDVNSRLILCFCGLWLLQVSLSNPHEWVLRCPAW